MLAAIYAYGDIVTNDPANTPKWFREAAEQGDTNAQFVLKLASAGGGIRALNKIFPSDRKNMDAAITNITNLFRKAAEQGNADAQYFLGIMLFETIGNTDEISKWFRKAAEQGHVDAQVELARQYAMSGNWVESAKWYRKAADQGNEAAKKALELLRAKLTSQNLPN